MRKAAYQLDPQRKIMPVVQALAQCYRSRRRPPRRDPLAVLVGGVLSQNTTDVNSGRAFEALMERFGDWSGVARGTVGQIAAAIHNGGLAEQKAGTIKGILGWLGQRGDYSLDFLRALDSAEGERQLTAIKGVGIKTARLVLLFGLRRPVFVVDTHVHRVSRRLGLIPARCGRQKAHVLLDGLIPDSDKYSGHMNMIQHGRRTCRARSPLCDGCCVRRWCIEVRGRLD